MGKAAIYNPYLDTLGGGERYTLYFAKVLADEGYDIEIQWKNSKILSKLEKRFGKKTSKKIKIVKDINRGKGYDLCFWVSDGSIPNLKAKKNLLHFQVPFQNVKGKSIKNKIKLLKINKVICNSRFTKKTIDKEFGVRSIVLYPPVSEFKDTKKENTILYVGRFSNLVQSKGQEILIDAFKNLIKDKKFSDWKLVLAGGDEIGARGYLQKLKEMSKNYPIEIITKPSFFNLKKLYGSAKIFWSAAGYGVNENAFPERAEHFGITVVEAMSAGCVPLVCRVGGYKEIIDDKKDGFLWQDTKELLDITKSLKTNKSFFDKISKSAKIKAERFSEENFRKNLKKII